MCVCGGGGGYKRHGFDSSYLYVASSGEGGLPFKVSSVDNVVFPSVQDELGQVDLALGDGIQQGRPPGRQALAVVRVVHLKRREAGGAWFGGKHDWRTGRIHSTVGTLARSVYPAGGSAWQVLAGEMAEN